jgi:hypothetical protein
LKSRDQNTGFWEGCKGKKKREKILNKKEEKRFKKYKERREKIK